MYLAGLNSSLRIPISTLLLLSNNTANRTKITDDYILHFWLFLTRKSSGWSHGYPTPPPWTGCNTCSIFLTWALLVWIQNFPSSCHDSARVQSILFIHRKIGVIRDVFMPFLKALTWSQMQTITLYIPS